MDNPNSLFIQTLAHKVLWRLEDGKKYKPNDELDEGDATHSDNEIPPAHIICSVANSVLLAREIRQDGPSNERGHNLGHSPIHGQDGQEILMRAWQEL